jgi:hypothetical protein
MQAQAHDHIHSLLGDEIGPYKILLWDSANVLTNVATS